MADFGEPGYGRLTAREWENAKPVLGPVGLGPTKEQRDRADAEVAERKEMQKKIDRLNDIANLSLIISYVVSDYEEARKAANLLYNAGYRKVEGEQWTQ